MKSDLAISAFVGAIFISAAVAIVLGTYAIARRLLHAGEDGDRTSEVAGTVAGRILALHGLILALVYAQELDDYKGVRNTLTEEAVAIADVYNDIARYGGDAVQPVQEGLAAYLSLVVGEEWRMLGRREGLSPAAWAVWEGVYDHVLDLSPATSRETFLSGRLRDRTTAVARFRELRESTAVNRFSTLFWAPAILGLSLLTIPFYVYRPTASHLTLLTIFGAYSGIILFFIFAFSNPFAPPGKLEPVPFLRLLEGEIGQSLPTD